MKSVVDSPLKWHGGKSYLASRIVEMMPPHIHYVEPFAGGLSVLLAKNPEGVSEVVNDLNYDLTNFWCAIQGEESFQEFRRRVEAIPFSQVEWEGAGVDPGVLSGMLGRAVAFFVRCRQSLAGRMDAFAPLSRRRVRRGMNEQASAWLSTVEGLPEVHARLKRVVILNDDALRVIAREDGDQTLFYLDPPYLPESRTSKEVYAHEMSVDDHRKLLGLLTEVKGKFLLSGYPTGMYDDFAQRVGWHRTDFDLPNNSAGGTSKRRMTECVWTNFKPGAKA